MCIYNIILIGITDTYIHTHSENAKLQKVP